MLRLANAIGTFIVRSVLSLEGILVTAALLLTLSIGGGLTLLWRSFAWTSLMVGLGFLGFAAILVFIIIPLIHIDIPTDD